MSSASTRTAPRPATATPTSLPSPRSSTIAPRPSDRDVAPRSTTIGGFSFNEHDVRALACLAAALLRETHSGDAAFLALHSARHMARSQGVPDANMDRAIGVASYFWKGQAKSNPFTRWMAIPLEA